MDNKNIEKLSVVLAQLFVDNAKGINHESAIDIGKYVIKFINK